MSLARSRYDHVQHAIPHSSVLPTLHDEVHSTSCQSILQQGNPTFNNQLSTTHCSSRFLLHTMSVWPVGLFHMPRSSLGSLSVAKATGMPACDKCMQPVFLGRLHTQACQQQFNTGSTRRENTATGPCIALLVQLVLCDATQEILANLCIHLFMA